MVGSAMIQRCINFVIKYSCTNLCQHDGCAQHCLGWQVVSQQGGVD